MRKLILKTAISLDGFLEGPGGAMDWFRTDDAVWQEEFKLYADVDTVLLGRGMYPGYAQHWRGVLAEPAKHPQEELAYARWADKTRHVVFSRELKSVDWANMEIMRDAASDVPRLKREAGKNLIVYGGGRFAGALIDQGLVDEYHLVVEPVALGGGKPLFNNLSKRRALKWTDAKPLPSGAVWLSYKA
ncbi:MAG: dihydrofolate reductase family protein [Gammaproteobacteria bacterium]